MYRRILVPIDNSETLRSSITQIASLSSDLKECNITLLHVEVPVQNLSAGTVGAVPITDNNMQEQLMEEGHEILKQATEWLRAYNIEPNVSLHWGDPATEICKYAAEKDIDLIAVGRHDKGLFETLFLGSVSQKVVQNAPCSVLVMK